MTTLKRVPPLALLALMLLPVSISSCGDDDDEEEGTACPVDAGPGPMEPDAEINEAEDAGLDASVILDGDLAAADAACLDSGEGLIIDDLNAKLLHTLSPLPSVPADSTNRVANSPLAAALGQKLFFDALFSGPLRVASDLGAIGQSGLVSCADCHSSSYLDDARSVPDNVSLGTDFHTRNSPPLVNSAFYKWTNWGGRFSTQWELPPAVLENPVTMNGTRLQLAHRIYNVYKTEYEAIFGALEPALAETTRFPASGKPKAAASDPDGPWELMTGPDRAIVNTVLVNYAKSLAAYMRLLVSRNAPFDKWMAGDVASVDTSAKRGAALFVGKAGCVSCHSGPNFADDQFHNIGVAQTGLHVPASDDGRFKDVPPLLASALNSSGVFSDDRNAGLLSGLTNPMDDKFKSAFRTPSLRGVELTAPYMHSGQIATLEGVINFYNVGGGTPASGTKDARLVPLGLSDGEKADLLSFLRTLTGEDVPPALLVDSTP